VTEDVLTLIKENIVQGRVTQDDDGFEAVRVAESPSTKEE
jgi:hypothetical protein